MYSKLINLGLVVVWCNYFNVIVSLVFFVFVFPTFPEKPTLSIFTVFSLCFIFTYNNAWFKSATRPASISSAICGLRRIIMVLKKTEWINEWMKWVQLVAAQRKGKFMSRSLEPVFRLERTRNRGYRHSLACTTWIKLLESCGIYSEIVAKAVLFNPLLSLLLQHETYPSCEKQSRLNINTHNQLMTRGYSV